MAEQEELSSVSSGEKSTRSDRLSPTEQAKEEAQRSREETIEQSPAVSFENTDGNKETPSDGVGGSAQNSSGSRGARSKSPKVGGRDISPKRDVRSRRPKGDEGIEKSGQPANGIDQSGHSINRLGRSNHRTSPKRDARIKRSKGYEGMEKLGQPADGIDQSGHSINRLGRSNHRQQPANGIDRSAHSQGRSNHRRKSPHQNGNTGRGGPTLSWKSDPEASFSDWRVEIYYNDYCEPDVYNLHRNIVGYGPRKSSFLTREFIQSKETISHDNDANENDAKATRLDLTEAQAQVFPMILDFMYYTKEVKQSLTAERACAVYKLSEKLELPALQNSIAEFYRKNLSVNNMGEFLNAASKANIDRLLLASRAKIGTLIIEKPKLASHVPPKFLAEILEVSQKQLEELRSKEPEKYPQELELSQSKHWSKVAYVCASHNESIMTTELFEQLTSAESLPAIDVSVALKFLALDAKFHQETSEYTSLQQRCFKSITNDWEAFQKGYSSPESMMHSLKGLPSQILADILVKSMNRPQS
jgi:hypothetical protein